MRHRESSAENRICSITDLPQETRKISNKQYNPILKRIRNRTTSQAQNKWKEENNKD